jgi:Ca2+-binding RTX toxin-like protein
VAGDDLGLVGDNLSAGAVTSAGHDAVDGGDGNDRLFGDNVDTTRSATFGSAGGNDVLDAGDGADFLRAGPRNDFLDGGLGSPDDCDGEAGTDSASGCEIVAGVP